MDEPISLRSITPDDDRFLYRVYASTREDELAIVPWDEAEKQAFLAMQYTAQKTFYREQFGQAEFQLILLGDEPVGRLYLDRREDEIRIIDIALLTEHRRKGIGSHLLREILVEGEAAGLPVRIHVERYNPALRLYDRLGFKQIGDQGVYYLMEWSPDSSSNPKGLQDPWGLRKDRSQNRGEP
jgi:ribosomal protein S18 acetylase RimI-like enzyme